MRGEWRSDLRRGSQVDQPCFAPNRSVFRPKPADVWPVRPFRRPRWIGWVPHVVAVCVIQCRGDSHARPVQAIGEVVILAAPPHKTFIKAIDSFEVLATNPDVVSREFRFRRVIDQLIVFVLDPFLKNCASIRRAKPNGDRRRTRSPPHLRGWSILGLSDSNLRRERRRAGVPANASADGFRETGNRCR